MDLLERYLQAVGQYLPQETREDVLAELRVNLLAEMDARADEMERPLTESEAAAIPEGARPPILVAAQCLAATLTDRTCGLPLLSSYPAQGGAPGGADLLCGARGHVIFSPSAGAFVASVATSFAQLVPVLLLFWGAVTMTFAILEFAHTQTGQCASWNAWDPAKLPPLTSPKKEKSLASRIADLVLHCLWILYVLEVPQHPYLILGPGALFLTKLSAGFAPMWRLFYVTLIIVLLAQLGIKLMSVARGSHRSEQPLELFTNLLGLVPAGLLAFNKVYFVPASPAANLHALTQINYWTNVGFRIGLMFMIVYLLVESWQYLRRVVPAERLAF